MVLLAVQGAHFFAQTSLAVVVGRFFKLFLQALQVAIVALEFA
jgi:hypothetical protein